MARPAQEETDLITANCDGRILVWCDGALSGDEEMRREAERATRMNTFVEISKDFHVYADHKATSFPEHVIAALLAYNPGRTMIVEMPDTHRERLRNLKQEDTHVQNG